MGAFFQFSEEAKDIVENKCIGKVSYENVLAMMRIRSHSKEVRELLQLNFSELKRWNGDRNRRIALSFN